MNAFSNEPQTITVIAKLIVTTPAGAAFENRFKNQADTVEWMKACLNCNANHAKVDIEPLCASDDPAFQAQISALKEVTDTLNTGLRSEDQEEDPTPEQLAALSRFAKRVGADWKGRLSAAWTSGKDATMPDGHLLRQLRNRLGPEWLMSFTLP